jgi:hypothetical protein
MEELHHCETSARVLILSCAPLKANVLLPLLLLWLLIPRKYSPQN